VLEHLLGEDRGVRAAEHHRGAAPFQLGGHLVGVHDVGGVHAQADEVPLLDVVEGELLDRLVDQANLSDVVLVRRDGGQHGQGARRRDRKPDALGIRRRVDQKERETIGTPVTHDAYLL
jgi:hypothetical protein